MSDAQESPARRDVEREGEVMDREYAAVAGDEVAQGGAFLEADQGPGHGERR